LRAYRRLKIMSTKHKNINKIMASVSATLAVEGLKPSEYGTAITCKYLEGKLTSREAIQRIKEKHLKYYSFALFEH
jgi:hypothetical protein